MLAVGLMTTLLIRKALSVGEGGTMPTITLIAILEAAARRYLMTHMSREKWVI